MKTTATLGLIFCLVIVAAIPHRLRAIERHTSTVGAVCVGYPSVSGVKSTALLLGNCVLAGGCPPGLNSVDTNGLTSCNAGSVCCVQACTGARAGTTTQGNCYDEDPLTLSTNQGCPQGVFFINTGGAGSTACTGLHKQCCS